jgi:hypothetical protein
VNTLLAGRPSGRRPYVGSKFSRSDESGEGGVAAGAGDGDDLVRERVDRRFVLAMDSDRPDDEGGTRP